MAQVSRGALNQRNPNALEVQVALVGLTRLSASFGLALREASDKPNVKVVFNVQGYDPSPEIVKQAQALGVVLLAHADLSSVVQTADVVVLDVPLSEQAEMLQRLGMLVRPGTVIFDFAPLKTIGSKLAKQYFPKGTDGKPEIYLVGVTPQIRMPDIYAPDSINATHPQLFSKNDLIIVPAAYVPSEAVKVASDIADLLELKGRFMEPLEYDGLVGMSEGMPQLLSLLFWWALENMSTAPHDLPRFLAIVLMQGIQQSKGRNDILRTANGNFGVTVHPLHDATAADMVSAWAGQRDLLLEFIEQVALGFDILREVMKESDPAEALANFIQETMAKHDPFHPSFNLVNQSVADLTLLLGGNLSNLRHHIEQLSQALETMRGVLMESEALVREVFVQQVLDTFGEWEIRRRDNRWDEDYIGTSSSVLTSSMGGIVNTYFRFGRKKD